MALVVRGLAAIVLVGGVLVGGPVPAGADMTCTAVADTPVHVKAYVGSSVQVAVPYTEGEGHGHCDWAAATGVAACLLVSPVPTVPGGVHACTDNASVGDDSSTTVKGACASGYWTTSALATGAGVTGTDTSDPAFSGQYEPRYCMPQVIVPPQPG